MSSCKFTVDGKETSKLYTQLEEAYGKKKALELMSLLRSDNYLNYSIRNQDPIEGVEPVNEQNEPSFEYVKKWYDSNGEKYIKEVQQFANVSPTLEGYRNLNPNLFKAKPQLREDILEKLKKLKYDLDGQQRLLTAFFSREASQRKRAKIRRAASPIDKFVNANNRLEKLKAKLEDAEVGDIPAIEAKIKKLNVEIQSFQIESSYVDSMEFGISQLEEGIKNLKKIKEGEVDVRNLKFVQNLNSIIQFIKEVEDTYKNVLLSDKDQIDNESVKALHDKLTQLIGESSLLRIDATQEILKKIIIEYAENKELATEYFLKTQPDLMSWSDALGLLNFNVLSGIGKSAERNLGNLSESSDILLAVLDKMMQSRRQESERVFRTLNNELTTLENELLEYQKQNGVNVSDFRQLYGFALQKDENGNPIDRLLGFTSREYQEKLKDLEEAAFDELGIEKSPEGLKAYVRFIADTSKNYNELMKEREAKQKSLEDYEFELYDEENFDHFQIKENNTVVKYVVPKKNRLELKEEWKDREYLQLIEEDSPKSRYFKFFLTKYNELAEIIPDSVFDKGGVLMGIRASVLEKLSNDGNIMGAVVGIGSSITNYLIDNRLDISPEFISASGEVKRFPKLEGIGRLDAKDKSFNLSQLLRVMAASTLQFKSQTEAMSTMENALQVLRNKQFYETDARGLPIVDKQTGQPIPKEGAKSRAFNALADYMAIHLYGEGKIPRDQADKIFKFMGRSTSLITMGFNLLSLVPNMAIGRASNWIEAFGGELFTKKDLLKANGTYNIELGSGRMFTYNTLGYPKSKLQAVLDQNNFIQDSAEYSKNKGVEKRSVLEKLFNANNFFILQKLGDHTHQATAALAYMYNKKVIDSRDNTEKSFYDTIEYTENGDIIYHAEMTKQELNNFLNATKGIVQSLHGNYSTENAVPLQRKAIGQLVLAYRKWIKPTMDARYRSGAFNKESGMYDPWWDERIGKYRKGRFVSGMDFMRLVFKNGFNVFTAWNMLNDVDRQNMRKNAVEFSMFLSLTILASALKGAGDDDKELRKDRLFNYSYYLADRLSTEFGFYIPGYNITEAQKMLKSPMASISILNRAVRLGKEVGVTVTEGEFRKFESGWRKGKYKLPEYFLELTPIKGIHSLGKLDQKYEFGATTY